MIKKAGRQCENQRPDKLHMLMTGGLALALSVSGFSSARAENYRSGQAVTGKIVIDGVVYGEGAQQFSKGSGDFGRDKRQLETFHSVKVLGGVDINYRRDPVQRVEITGDRNLLPLIKTQVSRGILTIGSAKSYQTQLPLTVELNGPVLKAMTMKGAGDIALSNLDEASLSLELNGSGDVTAQGRVGYLVVKLTGSSDVDAKRLISNQAEISLTGSGDLDVTVREFLKVQILGSGDVTYYGNPATIDKRVIGSGDIRSGD